MDVTDVGFATPFRQFSELYFGAQDKKDAEQEESHARAI